MVFILNYVKEFSYNKNFDFVIEMSGSWRAGTMHKMVMAAWNLKFYKTFL